MSSRYAVVLKILVLAGGALLAACAQHAPPDGGPAAVVALPVSSGLTRLDDTLRYPIEAVPRYQNVQSFRVGGKIIERRVRLGDRVHAGQVLAQLDSVDAGAEAAAARAALDAADHRLRFAKQQLDRDTAQAAAALIAASALEQTEDAYSAALAAREQAAEQLAVARNGLDYHRLTADHDGAVTSEYADTGQNVAAGQAVYGIAWSGDIDAVLDAAATDLAELAIGQHALVTFTALPGTRIAATVREIAPAADPASRSYRVKLSLETSDSHVRLGMTGEAQMSPVQASGARTQPATPAYVVPATAVFHKDNSTAVWVIRNADSTLELRPVSVRRYTAGEAYVEAGLNAGDVVVQAGVHMVFAGERVKAIKPPFSDDEGDGR
jgi:RND family efflux transporter MFP subunit